MYRCNLVCHVERHAQSRASDGETLLLTLTQNKF